MKHVSQVVSEVLRGIELERAKKYLVERRGDPLEAIPTGGGVVNVYFVVEALSDLVLRHEGGDDLTEVNIRGYEVPAITDSKLDGAYRRTAIQQIGYVFKDHASDIRTAIEDTLRKLMLASDIKTKAIAKALLGLARLEVLDKPYSCAVRPYAVGGRDYIGGMCRECPNCYLFGFAVPEEGRGGKSVKVPVEVEEGGKVKAVEVAIGQYNVQSRVRGDLYPATAPSSIITGFRTHNAVDDVTKTTGQALITIRYVRAGSVFVGKLAYYDVSLNELVFLLATLARIPRIGAMWSDYGRVKIYVPAILFADQEAGSGYEIAERILTEELPKNDNRPLPLEKVREVVVSYAEEFRDLGYLYADRELSDRLLKLSREAMKDIVLSAWVDTIKLKVAYEHFTT